MIFQVSIHAPRFREAMPGLVPLATRLPLFQSTLPVSGRRCPRTTMSCAAIRPFQSTPPVSGRRCLIGLRLSYGRLGFQSTPPVSGRRCARDRHGSRLHACFNPRPPFPGGDALWLRFEGSAFEVSIHAPRFREAMHHPRLEHMLGDVVSIHAPRFREAMLLCRRPRRCGSAGFNPRPPFPGGDARQ